MPSANVKRVLGEDFDEVDIADAAEPLTSVVRRYSEPVRRNIDHLDQSGVKSLFNSEGKGDLTDFSAAVLAIFLDNDLDVVRTKKFIKRHGRFVI